MKEKLLQFLANQTPLEFAPLNGFLQSLFDESHCLDARAILAEAVNDGLINMREDAHINMCSMVRLNANDAMNTQATFSNYPLFGRITDKGREQLIVIKRNYYETGNAKRSFEDYSEIRKEAKTSLLLARISIVIAVLAALVSLLSYIKQH